MANRSFEQQLRAAASEATKRLSDWLDARFTDEISASKWDYPTPPQVRDIVDTGRLRASQTRVVKPDGSVTFSWPVEYAAQVHEGGVAVSGLRFPGRPWTKAPLEEASAQYQRFFEEALRRQRR